jgi:hypothetical protein
MGSIELIQQYPWILISQIWTIPLKGLSLWVSARKEKKELVYRIAFSQYFRNTRTYLHDIY